MFEKDRSFVTQQVLRVMSVWGVQPSGRGTGIGDFEYWVDVIIAAKGWEPYWEEDRMPREFTAAGYHRGLVPPDPQPQPTPAGDPYMPVLIRIESKLDQLLTGLRSYFR